MKLTRIMLAGLLAAAAQPALAGVVYVPTANTTVGGVNRLGFMYLSNQDAAAVQGVAYRYIKSGVAGVPVPTTAPAIQYVAAGASALTLPTSLLGGETGMVEIMPGYGNMIVGSRFRYSTAGGYSTVVDMPGISSRNVIPANTVVYLQGVEHGSTSGVITDLALFNLGASAASCTMSVYSGANGATIAANLPVSVAALSSVMYADFFGGQTPVEVPAHSRIQLSCDSSFYFFGIRHDTLSGATSVLLPTSTLSQSALTQPTDDGGGGEPPPPPPPPSSGTLITLPGTFLSCTSGNKFWKYSLSNGATSDQTFKRIIAEVDVYHANWDPSKTVHIYMWLQNGQSWANDLFGYTVAIKGQNKFKNQIRYGRNDSMDASGGASAGSTYHAYLDWNGGTTRQITYRITRGGSTIAQKTASLTKGSFTVHGMFIGLGSWPTGHGPEALQYGWRYSNLKVQYFR
jgi:hypothetical protein